jgi:hypothetical protein
VAGTFDAVLSRVPNGRAPQMRTDGNESIHAFFIANDPHPMFLLHPRTDLANLIVFWLAGLKTLRGLIQNPREEKSQGA